MRDNTISRFKRIQSAPFYGNGICRMCQKPVKKPRRWWCSQACVDAGNWLNNVGWIRKRVFERDKGVCAACGFDAGVAGHVMDHLAKRSWNIDGQRYRWPTLATMQADERAANEEEGRRLKETKLLLMFLWTGVSRMGGHLWEADHIVPVVEGGGACGLDGYRTLCLLCHKAATAALAKRLAMGRREGAMPLLPDCEISQPDRDA